MQQMKNSDDYKDIEPLCKKNSIDFYLFDSEKPNALKDILKALKPDVVFCLGWPRLLKKDVLDIPRVGTVGFHPAKIPMNRGRHPIIWSIALGLKKAANTFFYIDEGADSGDIISQVEFTIEKDDYANDFYKKMTLIGLKQLEEIFKNFENNDIKRIKQNHEKATYWRKRSLQPDGIIDWRMPAENIRNLIRALSEPYSGAIFYYKDKPYVALRADVIREDRINLEPGKVLASSSEGIIVKCGNDSILLTSIKPKIQIEKDDYL